MKFSKNYEIYRNYVFDKKYNGGNESVQDMYNRITKSIIKKAVELYGELDPNVVELKAKLPEFMGVKWIPGGSILSNLGIDTHALNSLANCTVYFNKDDSYSGISQNEESIRNLCKRRCGTGQDISHYRPEGATILNAAVKSTGITTRMESFSNVLLEVAQNGRRGALMLTCHINHPDILNFITYKSLDVKNCNGANVSVLFTDSFFSAVKSKDKNERWIMKYPIDTELTTDELDKVNASGINELVELSGGRSAKWNLVSEIWSTFVKCNIKGAEPGAIYIDTVRKAPTNLYEEGYVESTNPCLTGDTIVAVADGRNGVSLKDLYESGESFPVYSGRRNRSTGDRSGKYVSEIKSATAIYKGIKKVILVNLSDGSSFKCTPNHLLFDSKFNTIEAKDSVGVTLSEFYTYTPSKGKKYRYINSTSYNRQYQMIAKFMGIKGETHHIDEDSTNDLWSNLQALPKYDHIAVTDRSGSKNPINLMDAELRQLLNKRKNIQGNAKRWNWSEEKLTEKLREFDEINESRISELKCQEPSNFKVPVISVVSISELGEESVFDLQVEDNHNFAIITKSGDSRNLNCSGIIVHNCGEIPLPIADSCRLSSVILSAYPDFMEKDYFDDFRVMGFATDILIDLDIEYTEAILQKVTSQNKNGILDKEVEMWTKFRINAINMRRNGMGPTGLADFFAANRVIYGAPESIELTDKVSEKFSRYVSQVSVYLAKCYGAFPIWDYEKEKDNTYIKDNFLPIEDYKSYGRRWIASLTVAPNGSLSILTGTSSGVEPLFAKKYNRISLGKTFEITHPFITAENEAYYIEAKEVDALAKVSILSKMQKYWDNSISVTYNLPKGVSESLVSSLYLKSYELGNKGMTIYVDGSRDNVYSDISEKPYVRPEFLECDVHHLNFNGERWVAFIGLLDGKLWEVFLGIEDEDRYLPKSIKKGHLKKVSLSNGNSRYDFRFKDKYGYYCYVGGVNHIFKSDLWNYGRLISALMRNNSPSQLYQIVSKLYNESESINSWKSNLLRVIKTYIKEGESLNTKCSVPECGGNLIKRDGCITCEKCGIQSCN